MNFNEKPILFGDVRSEHGIPLSESGKEVRELLKKRIKTDKTIADLKQRITGKYNGFTQPIIHDDDIAPTLTAGSNSYRYCDAEKLSDSDCKNIQTFPQDYDFLDQSPKYVCGMSVPPVMMAQISSQVYEQWLSRK